MQRFADDKSIRRNAQMGKVLLIGGLGVLLLGVVVSVFRPQEQNYVIALALGGMVTSQFGMAYTSRWGRSPRMDELLDDALKGMDARSSLFHYCLGANHVLVSPAGVFALVPRADRGEMRFADGTWSLHQEKSGLLRRPSTRKIRGIERDVQLEIDLLNKALHKHLPEAKGVEPGAILLFVSSNVTLHVQSAPFPAFHAKKAKDGIRKLERRSTLTAEQVAALAQKLRVQ
jgi:hypothetical protein